MTPKYSYRQLSGSYIVVETAKNGLVAEYHYKNDLEKTDAWQKALRRVSELNGSVKPDPDTLQKKPPAPSVKKNYQAGIELSYDDYLLLVTDAVHEAVMANGHDDVVPYGEFETETSFRVKFRGNDFLVSVTKV